MSARTRCFLLERVTKENIHHSFHMQLTPVRRQRQCLLSCLVSAFLFPNTYAAPSSTNVQSFRLSVKEKEASSKSYRILPGYFLSSPGTESGAETRWCSAVLCKISHRQLYSQSDRCEVKLESNTFPFKPADTTCYIFYLWEFADCRWNRADRCKTLGSPAAK